MVSSAESAQKCVGEFDLALTLDADPQIRCPVCRARQALSDECRRCKCDLTMVRQLVEAARQAKRRCLSALEKQDVAGALKWAQRFDDFVKTDESSQLVRQCRQLQQQEH